MDPLSKQYLKKLEQEIDAGVYALYPKVEACWLKSVKARKIIDLEFDALRDVNTFVRWLWKHPVLQQSRKMEQMVNTLCLCTKYCKLDAEGAVICSLALEISEKWTQWKDVWNAFGFSVQNCRPYCLSLHTAFLGDSISLVTNLMRWKDMSVMEKIHTEFPSFDFVLEISCANNCRLLKEQMNGLPFLEKLLELVDPMLALMEKMEKLKEEDKQKP